MEKGSLEQEGNNKGRCISLTFIIINNPNKGHKRKIKLKSQLVLSHDWNVYTCTHAKNQTMKFLDLPLQLEGDCSVFAHSTCISDVWSELLLELCGMHSHTLVVLNSAPHNHISFSLLGNHSVQLRPNGRKTGSLFFFSEKCKHVTI